MQNIRIENGSDILNFGYSIWAGSEAFNGSSGSLYLDRNISGLMPFKDNTLITSVTIGNQVSAIPANCFDNCSALTNITIGSEVISIGYSAFAGCIGITQIISNATTPPALSSNTFYNVSTSIPIYVPCGSYIDYQKAQYWSGFTNFVDYCTEVIPAENSAVISWTEIENAAYYEVFIYADASHTQIIGHYIVYADGTVIKRKSGDEFSLLVEGLSASTPYYFTITSYHSNDTEIVTFTGDFQTTAAINFIAVTNIANVPTATTVGTPLTLIGTVEPSNATNQTIVWRVKDAGATGANITGNVLNTIANGAVKVTATITDGLAMSTNYVQDFNIMVNAVGIGIVETDNYPSLRVYPNPAGNQLIVEIAGKFPNDGNVIEIYDVVGQTVGAGFKPVPTNAGNGIVIDISHLATGIYFLKIDKHVIKFVKE